MRIALIAAAILAASSAAAAGRGGQYCVLSQSYGVDLECHFDAYAKDIIAQWKFVKGGVATTFPDGKRPPWRWRQEGDFVILSSVNEPGWRIVIENQLHDAGSVMRSEAALYNPKGTQIAKGGCGWNKEDYERNNGQPAKPAPGVGI